MIANHEFGFVIGDYMPEESAPLPEVPPEPVIPIRTAFPEAGSDYLGGECNGWEYRTAFMGSRLGASFEMVVEFLKEHGYADIPVPASIEELLLFRRQRTKQLQLFPERGYIHNPVKILFHPDPAMRNALVLCLYNEAAPDHLLRFHGVIRPKKKGNYPAA